MSDPFIGEIQAFPFPFASGGFNQAWMPCFGQLLPIRQFTPLFALIGIYYGGNGTANFALPNLSGSVAIGQGDGPGLTPRIIGEMVGSSTVTVLAPEMAMHSHGLQLGVKTASDATAGPGSQANLTAIDPTFNGFASSAADTMLAPNAILPTGGGRDHNNMQPTQALIWCIAYAGIFPSFD